MKGIRMNSKATAAALTLAIPLAAVAQTSVEEKQSKIEQALENVLSKQGISIGGVATGEYINSTLSGNATDPDYRTTEPDAYTQVDFDLRARPNNVTVARAVFRLHTDWANLFESPSTPIESRWLSLDGKAAQDMFYYSVGDMGLKWTPYTMWAPDVNFLFTPAIFAQGQQQAMAERFQGDNRRNLQGIQLGFRAAAPLYSIDSMNVNVIGNKLYTAGDSALEKQVLAYPFSWGTFDRYLVGGRGEVAFMKGMNLGLAYLMERDLKSTYTGTNGNNGRDSAQKGQVVDGHISAQIDKMTNLDKWKVGAGLEFAQSQWQSYTIYDSSASAYVATPKLTGKAINANVSAGYLDGKNVDATLSIGYLMNDSAFRNDVAQSPTFYGRRILNTEQENFNTWNTFDAMYHNVYRYITERASNGTSKNAIEKVAYTNQVLDPTMYSTANLDWNVQMVLPNGLATANRVGPTIDLNAGFLDNAIDVRGAFYSLQEAAATSGSKAKFTKMQAGAKVRLDPFLKGTWNLPIEIAGSYEQNKGTWGDMSYTSKILNAGAQVGVYKNISLLFGYQKIDGALSGVTESASTDSILVLAGAPISNKQTNLGVGAQLKVQEGAYLMAMYEKMTVEYPNWEAQNFTQNVYNVKLQIAF
jgi:hypothetical protein